VRILHVNKFLYRRGGAEGYLLDVAAMQRDAGHVVEYWGMDHPDNEPALPLADTFPSYVELEPPPGGLAALGAGARMVWSRESRRGLARAVARFAPDVVHCHNIYHQLSPSILAATKAHGVPVVMTLHDYKLACPSYQMLDHGRPCDACVGHSTLPALRRRCKSGSLGASGLLALESGIHRLTGAYTGVDAFVSPSRFLAGVMTRAGIDPARLHVIPHFVSAGSTMQAAAAAAETAGAVPGVVFAGRLSHEKGVDTLVEAAALAPEVPVHVAGDGPERAALERLAADRGAANVIFHGRLAKPDLERIVAASVATVVPSRWYENQPMTILESYAAAVPAIVTSLGGSPELVDDGVDGLVVPADDPAALAAAMSSLAADPARARVMGRTGQARLLERHSPPRHLAALDALYAAVSGARVGGAA
jgi:glycosyltransferase involved in cell wall biosynthesis